MESQTHDELHCAALTTESLIYKNIENAKNNNNDSNNKQTYLSVIDVSGSARGPNQPPGTHNHSCVPSIASPVNRHITSKLRSGLDPFQWHANFPGGSEF
ncbi:hypothetical protein PoB_001226600 [Plakobranchus ocellatus]|uniref:Uncharacterized protein n=1 Tax=Plakobranchus ocellatus TaxID=259542 RepID=A0AAV3YEL6_9GAST|nr:hypothetical protein PoB_001226600 [Plakobranchus ocellatus]